MTGTAVVEMGGGLASASPNQAPTSTDRRQSTKRPSDQATQQGRCKMGSFVGAGQVQDECRMVHDRGGGLGGMGKCHSSIGLADLAVSKTGNTNGDLMG